MYGASRIITGVARDHLIPPFLARVHPSLATPYLAILGQGVLTALIALLTDFAELSEMVSISTLFAFWIVALGLIWRRSYVPGSSSKQQLRVTLLHLTGMFLASLVFSVGWRLEEGGVWLLIVAVVAFAGVLVSCCVMVKPQYTPVGYKAPFYPVLPALSVALNTFLMGQLQPLAYLRFGVWTAVCIVGYLCYGLHASAVKDCLESGGGAEQRWEEGAARPALGNSRVIGGYQKYQALASTLEREELELVDKGGSSYGSEELSLLQQRQQQQQHPSVAAAHRSSNSALDKIRRSKEDAGLQDPEHYMVAARPGSSGNNSSRRGSPLKVSRQQQLKADMGGAGAGSGEQQ